MFETALVTYPSAWSQEMVSLLKKVRRMNALQKEVIKSRQSGLKFKLQGLPWMSSVVKTLPSNAGVGSSSFDQGTKISHALPQNNQNIKNKINIVTNSMKT